MIFLVTHIDKAKGIGGHAPWIIEFAIGRALRTEGAQESTRRIEHLNAMIVSVGDNVLANTIHGHTGQTIEFAFTTSVLSEFAGKNAVRIEHLNSAGGERKREIEIRMMGLK